MTRPPNVTFDRHDPAPTPDVARAGPAGVFHDVFAIAGRALRAVPRDLEAIIPPIFIALFFFIVNIGTLREPHPEQHPGLRLHRVRDGDRGAARRHRRLACASRSCVDVQNGYFDRLLLTPVRRSAILVGHMVADVAVVGRAARADHRAGVRARRRLRAGALGVLVFIVHRRAVEPGLRRLRLRDRAEDRQPGGGELELPAVLPVPVPHLVVRAPRPAERLARHRGRAGTRSPTSSRACARSPSRAGTGTTSGKALRRLLVGVPHQLRRSASPPSGPG